MQITSSDFARITRLRRKGTLHAPRRHSRACPVETLLTLCRHEAIHTAAREAEAARLAAEAAHTAAKREEQIKAAAAAVKQQHKQQQKVDKTTAGTL